MTAELDVLTVNDLKLAPLNQFILFHSVITCLNLLFLNMIQGLNGYWMWLDNIWLV